jgi:hypothetical protein
MVVEKSSKATVHAPSLIRWPLNLGGQTPQQKLLNLDSIPNQGDEYRRHYRRVTIVAIEFEVAHTKQIVLQ